MTFLAAGREVEDAIRRLYALEGLDIACDAIAGGISTPLRELHERNWRPAPRGRECVNRVVGRICQLGQGGETEPCRPPRADHPEMYRARVDGELIYVSHPYGPLGGEELRAIVEHAERNGLEVSIYPDSHYFPLATLCVVYRAAGE